MRQKVESIIHITTGSSKMAGINSINTSTINNEFCSKMRETDSVCKKCYASRYEQMRPALHNKLEYNDTLLSSKIIDDDNLPFINSAFFRFNSFGELINENHLTNLINIVKKNPHCNFALWTKRKNLINDFFANNEKPSNLILIFSSSKLDKVSKLPKHFNKVFTAHNKKTLTPINCHGSCASCLLCYKHTDTVYINEIAK